MSSAGNNNTDGGVVDVDEEITVTLVDASTGRSESIPMRASSTTLREVVDLCRALFGGLADGDGDGVPLFLSKDGRRVFGDGGTTANNAAAATTLKAAVIRNGDVLAAQQQRAPAAGGGGGLDFSNLLAAAAAGGGGSSGSTTTTTTGAATTAATIPEPTYYPGMDLNAAMGYNPHPRAFVSIRSFFCLSKSEPHRNAAFIHLFASF